VFCAPADGFTGPVLWQTLRGRALKAASTQGRLDGFNRSRQPRRSRRAGQPLFPPRRRCRLRRTVFNGKRSEQEVFARRRRATLRERGANCLRLFAVVELLGSPRARRSHSRNRNLQLRGLLAQSRRRIRFNPGDEGIVAPVCVADTPGGPEPGSAAQLPKAVVHHHDAGHQMPLSISSVAHLRPGSNRILRQSVAAATHRQRDVDILRRSS
jgi:hypothetical protein